MVPPNPNPNPSPNPNPNPSPKPNPNPNPTPNQGSWSHLVMAAAAGTFVYVALCEVMPRELQSRRAPRGAQLASMAAGYAAMAVMAIWV